MLQRVSPTGSGDLLSRSKELLRPEGWVKLDSKDEAVKRNTSEKLHLKPPVQLKHAEEMSLAASKAILPVNDIQRCKVFLHN